MPLDSGTRVGPFEVLAKIGSGGMGEVYRARDTRLGREIAIKILPLQFSSDPERLSRFEKEARSASALNHPNIVTIHEIGQIDKMPYIAMELVDGKTLREIIKAGPLRIPRVLDIGTKIAEGLAKAHSAGIVHRDLKPENIMVTKDGFVKILDFGVAKLVQNDDAGLGQTELPTKTATEPGMVVGTVHYMSPEQARGEKVDFRSDQFSLGSILYEMVAGKLAFQRGSAVATLAAIIHEEPEPISSLVPDAADPIRWTIDRCLSKNPDDRYASTKDLARDLSTLLTHSSQVAASRETTFKPAEKPGRHAIVAWTVAALAILAATFLATNNFKRGPKSQQVLRFNILPPEKTGFNFAGRDAGPVVVSPDGTRLAFVATTSEGSRRLFVRALDSLDARPLEGTDGASYPFWAPDSGSLGFFAD